jgi:hypothetical protein
VCRTSGGRGVGRRCSASYKRNVCLFAIAAQYGLRMELTSVKNQCQRRMRRSKRRLSAGAGCTDLP